MGFPLWDSSVCIVAISICPGLLKGEVLSRNMPISRFQTAIMIAKCLARLQISQFPLDVAEEEKLVDGEQRTIPIWKCISLRFALTDECFCGWPTLGADVGDDVCNEPVGFGSWFVHYES